jgi:hypothetical protein
MTCSSLHRPAALAVGLALLLGGCSAATADQGAPAARAVDSGTPLPDGPGPEDRPDPALSGQPVPTLPPGDPGVDPAADGGGGDGVDGHGPDEASHGEHGMVTEVPGSALVDAETVGALAGGGWSVDPAGGEPCATDAPDGATASRSTTLASSDGRLVQTVSAHAGARAARVAVDGLADRLAGCGFVPDGDPRLGEASVQLARTAESGQELALVLAAEGATVVLVGSGSATEPGAWSALADVALGTACAAGEHGCH